MDTAIRDRDSTKLKTGKWHPFILCTDNFDTWLNWDDVPAQSISTAFDQAIGYFTLTGGKLITEEGMKQIQSYRSQHYTTPLGDNRWGGGPHDEQQREILIKRGETIAPIGYPLQKDGNPYIHPKTNKPVIRPNPPSNWDDADKKWIKGEQIDDWKGGYY
jgi:hypothetical protein